MILKYKINNNEFSVETPEQEFGFGESKVISNEDTDVLFNQDWYSDGYTSELLMTTEEFDNLKKGIEDTLSNIIKTYLGKDVSNFSLEKYHHYIDSDEEHFKVVSKTRDLFPADFNFKTNTILKKFNDILGFEVTDKIPNTDSNIHIIVRVNRPNSNDYNPPHKDSYAAFKYHDKVDSNDKSLKFINFWIPIAGVTDKTSLPIVPKSHLLSEDLVLKTESSGKIGKNSYRVVCIKEWDGSNELQRSKVNYGDVLVFSSHLIHGFAVNEELDTTRVALEFRLFKK
jgi:hypothetical protein